MSLVVPSLDFRFVHVPKTGGTWVREVLRANFPDATDDVAKDVSAQHGFAWHYQPTRITFAVVRHPLSWLMSYWRFMADRDWKPWETRRWHPCSLMGTENWPHECQSFNGFVRRLEAFQPAFVTRLFEWYLGPDSMPYYPGLIVGRQESLLDDLTAALVMAGHRLQLEIPAERTNESRQKPPLLLPETESLVRQLEAATIRRWYSDGLE